MVYSANDFGSSPASVSKPINLKHNSNENNTDKVTRKIKDMLVQNATTNVKKLNNNKKLEGFGPDTTCQDWNMLMNQAENKKQASQLASTFCNMDPDMLIFSLQSQGLGEDLTPEDLPRSKGCEMCKQLDNCKDGIKDELRLAMVENNFCNTIPKESWKDTMIKGGVNTDIYTIDYVCDKEFDPCYKPVADGSDTTLDSAPIAKPKPAQTPKTKPETKSEPKEINEEEVIDENNNIVVFLLLLLLIISYVIYNNVIKK